MSFDRSFLSRAIALAVFSNLSSAQTTSLISASISGPPGAGPCDNASISTTGRYVAFSSSAANLVPGDTNSDGDVFVRDRQTGATVRVSVATGGGQTAGGYRCSISSDGRYIAFDSSAIDVIASDTNNQIDVFVHDRETNTTTCASAGVDGLPGNAGSLRPSISDDGRYVAFESYSSNLVAGDTNGNWDVFVRDMQNGTTVRASVSSGGAEGNAASTVASISDDGLHVAFESLAYNLVAGDGNGVKDIFVRDLSSGSTELVSVTTGGAPAFTDSYTPSLSNDGRYVAFSSGAPNLVAGDTNGVGDVFVHDRQLDTTVRVSVASDGAQGNLDSFFPSISADGRFVAYQSGALALVPGDTNGKADVFVHDIQAHTVVRASVSTAGAQANNHSGSSSISGDGRYVAFKSTANNLVPNDANATSDILVRDSEPTFDSFCYGDGTGSSCPCGNSGAPGNGCENSAGTGGAQLTVSGTTSPDTVILTSSSELPAVLSIFLQGDSSDPGGLLFGDGVRCVAGSLKRLYVKNSVGGTVSAPVSGDPSIRAQSAALGDPIPAGASRHYQVYYRDPDPTFCPSPAGSSFNISSGVSIVW